MAMDVFQVLGSISVDTSEFNSKISDAIARVNALADALNRLSDIHIDLDLRGGSDGDSHGDSHGGSDDDSDDDSDDGLIGDSDGDVIIEKGDTVGRTILKSFATRAAHWAFDAAVDLARDGWERNINEEVMHAKYKSLGGLSDFGAWELLESVNQFARDTPLGVESAWSVASRLMNYGVAREDLIDTMWMLGDIAMGDSVNMLSTAKAYTETLGKNLLYAQEGYQFINAGVPIYDILEKYYASDDYTGPNKGLSAAEIKAWMNAPSGQSIDVPAMDVEAAFRMSTAEGGRYYNAMSNMMNTQYGLEQRLDENLTNISAAVVEPFQNFWKASILPSLVDFTAFLDEQLNTPKGEFAMITEELTAAGVLEAGSSGEALFGNVSRFLDNYSAPPAPERGHVAEAATNLFDSTLIGRLLNGENVFREWLYTTTGGMGYGLIPEAPVDGDYETQPLPVESLRKRRTGGGENDFLPGAPIHVMENIFDDNGSFLPGGVEGLSSLVTNLQNLPQQITAAVQSGFSGATVQINLTTGDVRLNEGTLVGVITPMVDARLGTDGARAERM